MKRSGDDDDFVEFVRVASPGLLRSAWFICGQAGAAEDLVQSALEKVYLRWDRLRDGSPLAYARRCLLNEHVDSRRRGRREFLTDAPPEGPHTTPDIAEQLALRTMLADLSPRERQVVVARYYMDLPERDVAEMLGIGVGTVKSSASRGLIKLRGAIAQEESCDV